MIVSSASPEAEIASAYSRCASSSSVSSRSSLIPITPFIGVRISWLTLATNIDFIREASSASSRASASSCSAALRSVMSRRNALKAKPCSISIGEMVSSTGNSWPSRCSAVSSSRRPSTGPSPVARKRSRPMRWGARRRSGMIVSASSRPSASPRGQPKLASAWEFQPVIRPRASIEMKASWAFSTIWRVRWSLRSRAASITLRWVTSRAEA